MKNIKRGILSILYLLAVVLIAQNKPEAVRTDDANIKISLNAYSFTKPLLNYAKDRGNGENRMTLFEFMDWSKKNGFDAVDLTGYFFPGYPNVPTDAFIKEVKDYAQKKGLEISGTGVRNDFANPDIAERNADIEHIKEWIDVASKLGAPVIRVFSGPIPEGYENRRDEITKYMVASLKACAEYGKRKGVLVGVQNHGDFLSTADQCIEIVKKVNTEGFGIINDTGYFMTEDPYVDIEKVMPYTVNFQLKESVFGAKSKVKIDLKRIMDIIKRSGYRGYIPIETLSPIGGNKKKSNGKKEGSDVKGEKKKGSGSEETEKAKPARPDYDPYQVVPMFFSKVKLAQKEAFGN